MSSRAKRVRLVIDLAAGAAIIFFMLRWFEHRQVYHPSSAVVARAESLGRPFEDVFIPVGSDKIHAWYFPADARAPSNGVAILVCHGNAGNITYRLDLAALLLEAHASVLLFDYRGYGQSTGKPGEEATFADAQAAYGWLRAKGFDGERIIAYGESLGGGVAAELAVREKLGGLILQSTFTSIPDIGAELFPWLPVRLVGSIKYNTRSKLPRIRVPVLIMHSRNDSLINFKHAQRNLDAANAPKYFCEIGGDHDDGIFVTHREFLDGIKKFLLTLPLTGKVEK
jgi:pimeloyl-ACP methyl ester carboxylesterase